MFELAGVRLCCGDCIEGMHNLLDPASVDVVVTLDAALDADGMVFPMAHVDANSNGVYEFAPPDVATDVPATTADGAVAVVGITYTIS